MKKQGKPPFTSGQVAAATGAAILLPTALLYIKYGRGRKNLGELIRKRLKETKLPLLGK